MLLRALNWRKLKKKMHSKIEQCSISFGNIEIPSLVDDWFNSSFLKNFSIKIFEFILSISCIISTKVRLYIWIASCTCSFLVKKTTFKIVNCSELWAFSTLFISYRNCWHTFFYSLILLPSVCHRPIFNLYFRHSFEFIYHSELNSIGQMLFFQRCVCVFIIIIQDYHKMALKINYSANWSSFIRIRSKSIFMFSSNFI